MNEIEQQIEEKALELVNSSKDNKVNEVIATEIQKSENVKDIIDLFATQTALNQQETLEKVVIEKEEELRNDAEAKRVVAETNRISKETERVNQQKEKELAELDKAISAKQKEVEQLKAESDKAQAFFDSNKDILSYIGLSSKKTLKIMYFLMIPAIVIFSIVQIIALPLTIGGKLLEIVINIVAGVCKAISNNAIKILVSIFVVLVLLSVAFCAYFFGIRQII